MQDNKPLLEYEPLALNSLTETGAKARAFKKLTQYQTNRGWEYNEGTDEWNVVSEAEDLERSIYLGIARKIWVIVLVDKNGLYNFNSLVELANNDPSKFLEVYNQAIEVNPTFALTDEGISKDPNE